MSGLINAFKLQPAWYVLLLSVFFSGVSMPIARVFLPLCLILVIIDYVRQRKIPRISVPSYGWFAYLLVAIIMSIIATMVITEDPNLNPAKGLSKIDKLIWYMGIPLIALLVDSKERFIQLLKWYVAGCVVAAMLVFVTYTFDAWVMCAIPKVHHMENAEYRKNISVASQWLYYATNYLGVYDDIWIEIRRYFVDRPNSFSAAFILQGTMQESQRLMVAVIAAFFLLSDAFGNKKPKKECLLYFVALLFIALGLVFTCKRGPLFAAMLILIPIALYDMWKNHSKKLFIGAVLVIVLLISAVFCLPASRQRISELPQELTVEKGGRYAMWTQIVPNIHKDYPYGIGFRALTEAKMRQYCPKMEDRPHSHVHSTPLQVFVEFSWLGIAVYSLWIILSIVRAIAFWRRGAGLFALIPIAIVGSLCLFGLVEYNLADAEVVLLYSLGMGLCDCVYLNTQYCKKHEKNI